MTLRLPFWLPTPLLVLAAVLVATDPASAQPADPAGAEVRVRAAAEAWLAERFPTAAPRLEPRVLRLSNGLPAAGPLRLEVPAADGLPRGHARAEVYADAGRAGWALLYVAHFDSVAVARRALGRGDTLSVGAVETAWLETTRFHGEPVPPSLLQTDAPPTARRRLDAGEALRASDLAWPAAVDTGDPVAVRYMRGALRLVFEAQARERGAVGEAIRVWCRATAATYRVRLTAPGEADWLATL